MGRCIATAASTDTTVKVLLIPNAAGMASYGYSDGANLLSGGTAQGTRSGSATQNYPLGMTRRYADGRVFRYIKAATALHTEFGACLASCKTITNAVAPTQATGAGTSGQYYVTVTVASGDGLAANGNIALNELVGGYVVIGNGGSQHPQNRLITGNTAVTGGAGGVCTLTLDEALDHTVLVGGSGVTATNMEVLMNPWLLSDGNVTNNAYATFRGMPACELTINQYGFVQTAGPCWITSDSLTADDASDRAVYFKTNGSISSRTECTEGSHPVYQLAGYVIDLSSSGSSNAPFVNLCMEYTA
jgi:hypothetical protein